MNRLCLALLSTLICDRASAQALTWTLVGDSASWPAGRSDAVSHAMNEGVAAFNRYGFFDKHVSATFNGGVPTAQANYDGWIEFGGTINPRVALHELAHALGTGTYWGFNNGPWDTNTAAGRLLKVYDGQAAVLGTGGSHFWPYGLNYDNEDGSGARERHCKLVAALRFDMGIVKDSDQDGMPDDWEIFHFQNLSQSADGDSDGDGIRNLDEYRSDADPNQACPLQDGHVYLMRTQLSARILTTVEASVGVQVALHSDEAPGQRFTAHYVGEGYFRFSSDDLVLEVPGTDTTSGLALQMGTWDNSLRQQWRVVSGPGAEPGYWVIANRETGRVVDGYDGQEGTTVKQYPFLGDIPQQFWSFTDEGGTPPDGGADLDADASVGPDGAVSPDDVGDASDAGTGGSGSTDSEAGGGSAAGANRAGCSLSAPSSASAGHAAWLLAGLSVLMARRRRARPAQACAR